MKYFFKRYGQKGSYLVHFTDCIAPSYRVYDLEEHKAIAFMDRWPEAVALVRCIKGYCGALII